MKLAQQYHNFNLPTNVTFYFYVTYSNNNSLIERLIQKTLIYLGGFEEEYLVFLELVFS
jgi:hypothetical protein